jgi:hypothetical protein
LQSLLNDLIAYIDRIQFAVANETETSAVEGPRLDEDFFSIPLNQYLSGRNSRFDLYLKLKSNKFVKVLHKGDSFDLHFLSGLEQRGVSLLYINRNKLSEYLKIQEKILSAIAKDYGAPLRFKSFVICGQGSQIFTCFQELQDRHSLQNLDLFIPAIQNMVEEYRIKYKKNFSKVLFQDTAEHHHSILTVIMGIIISKGQKILSQGPLKNIVMASMFHDISLENEIEAQRVQESDKFKQHPLLSEELLSRHNYFDSVVLQAVRQHHMRVRGESFPALSKNEVLNQISQIVGLSDEMSNSMRRVMGSFDVQKMNSFETYLDEKVFPIFSRGLVDPTKELVFGKKKQ